MWIKTFFFYKVGPIHFDRFCLFHSVLCHNFFRVFFCWNWWGYQDCAAMGNQFSHEVSMRTYSFHVKFIFFFSLFLLFLPVKSGHMISDYKYLIKLSASTIMFLFSLWPTHCRLRSRSSTEEMRRNWYYYYYYCFRPWIHCSALNLNIFL